MNTLLYTLFTGMWHIAFSTRVRKEKLTSSGSLPRSRPQFMSLGGTHGVVGADGVNVGYLPVVRSKTVGLGSSCGLHLGSSVAPSNPVPPG